MTLRILETSEYLAALGLAIDEFGLPTRASLAELSRLALWRWGLCPRSSLTKFLLERARAARLDMAEIRTRIDQVINGLIELGDIAKVQTTAGTRLARTKPCWVRLSDEAGAVTGTLPSSALGEGFSGDSPDDLVRRFDPGTVTTSVALREHGVAERSLEGWLGTPGFVRSLAHRDTAADGPVAAIWDALVREVQHRNLQISNLSGVRALTSPPGGFFGQPDGVPEKLGRWGPPTEEGVWLARRQGHGQHQQSLVIQVSSKEQVVSLDLYDEEDFRWALIARGCALGERELITAAKDAHGIVLRATFPLPGHATRALRLLGHRPNEKGWSWRIRNAALPAAREAFERMGIDVQD